MSTPTLDEALALIHPWLGHTPETCKVTGGLIGKLWCCAQYGWWAIETPPPPHTRPMPPASDALAMQVLRQLTIERVHVSFHPTEAEHTVLCALTPQYGSKVHGSAVADDPLGAIILAAGERLSATRPSRRSPVSIP